MGMAARAVTLARDTIELGPRFALVSRFGRRRTSTVRVRGFGEFTIRPKSSDVRTLRDIFGRRQYSLSSGALGRSSQEWYQSIIARGHQPLIIDAGANVGGASRWFAHEFPSARIVAIEPEPSNALLCRQNTVGLDIEVVEGAIGSERGFADLVTMDRTSDGVQTNRSVSDGVPVYSIAHLIAQQEPSCELFLVKVDIEGFEADLFASNTAWIDQTKVLFVEPHDWMLPHQRSSRNLQRRMGDADFDLAVAQTNLLYVRPLGSGDGSGSLTSTASP